MRLGNLTYDFPVLLAPMAGVTDMPFRLLCKWMGADLTYTEMVSAKGLLYGGDKTNTLLSIGDIERPAAVQLFGSDPKIMADMAKKVMDEAMGDIALIDINMGCPAPKITGNGEGSALMKNPVLASKIIEAVQKAIHPLPLTVKFRKGWDDESVNAVPFARMAEEHGAAAVCVHGRTREQAYSGRADWDIIGEVKASVNIPVIGNGDIIDAKSALKMREHTKVDAIMVARGAQGNPFIFREIKAALQGEKYDAPTTLERAAMAAAHGRLQLMYSGDHGIVQMRKHMSWYMRCVQGSASLRAKVNASKSIEDMHRVLLEFIKQASKYADSP